jgi:hypothetical protein
MCEVSCSTICFLVSFVIFAFIDLHIVQGNMHVSHRCPAKKHCLMNCVFFFSVQDLKLQAIHGVLDTIKLL